MNLPLKPLPSNTADLEIDADIEPEAFELIKKGYGGRSPDDKWSLLMDESLCLRIYRTATGSCIFEVQFATAPGGYTISRARVNRDPTQYRGRDPVDDARLLIYLIRKLLLHHNVPYPMPAAIPQQNKAIHERHVMGDRPDEPPSVIPIDL